MIRIGVCEWSLPVNGPSSVVLAGKAGFEGIQIGDLGGSAQGDPMLCPAIQEGYLQASADSGVQLQSLHPYGLQRNGNMLFPLDTLRGQQGAREVEHCIDACAAMKIPSLMLSSFFATLVRNEWDFETFAQQLRHACQYGEDLGVKVIYESVLKPDRLLRMIDVCNKKNIALCYDMLNPIRWGTGEPVEEIPRLYSFIDHFHIKDAPNDLKGYAEIGRGRGHLFETASCIMSLGYSGWIVSENYYTTLSADSGEDFLEIASRDIKMIRKLFAAENRPGAAALNDPASGC